MALSNVALTDTFDVWRTRTNQLVILTNDMDSNVSLYFTSNSAPLTLSASALRKGNVYFQLSSNSDVNNTQTTTVATSKAVNDSYVFGGVAFNKANAANLLAFSTGINASAAFDKANAANLLAFSTGITTVAAFDKANAALANASTVYSGTLQFSTAGSAASPSLTNVLGANTGVYWPAAGRLGLTANGQLGVYVNATGNVGIGTTTTSYKLYVQGDIYATGDITAFSSEAIKTDVATITNALNTVESLRGVSYTRTDNQQKKIGLIAQEVQRVLPEVVVNSDNNIGVNYQTLTALLIEAVKELSEKVRKLEAN
jgi:hypothetical protein